MAGKTEIDFMAEALELAAKGCGHTRPNPPVGAVVVRGGKVIGRGWHKKCGGDHAEVAAIKDAVRKSKSGRVEGLKSGQGKNFSAFQLFNSSTLYVTLEPCSKAGRVGACTDAIIAAGIKRVVYAVPDPNPKNRGKAKRALAKHGIACELFKGDKDVTTGCRELICDFRKHVTTGLPYVMVKLAISLDGKICDNWGDSNWISSTASRDLTNDLRSMSDAIMVGAETIRKDNPSLLARKHPNKDLIRVVISKSGRLPKRAQVFTDGKNPTLVFDDAKKALRELGKMGVMSVLCEGGLKLATSLAGAGLVDEWITVMAPVIIGSRRIGKAIRGTAFHDESFLVSGDSFYTVGLSGFSTWSDEGTEIKFDANVNRK